MPVVHSPLNSTQGWIFLGVNPGARYVYFNVEEPKKSFTEITAPLNLDDNIWHSVAGSVDRQRNEMRLFVDGVLMNSTINPGLVHNPSLVIGTQGYVWPALVSRLTVWTYARPETQLRHSYQTCTTDVSSNQLLGFFPFEIGYEGGKSILKDDSLSKPKNTGTLAGSLSLETVGPCVSTTRTPTLTEERTLIMPIPHEQLSPTKLLILLALVLTLPICGGAALAIGIYKYRRKRGATSGPSTGEFSNSLNRSSTPSDTSSKLHIRIMDVVLGTGSFGRVMQGVNLRNGELVAVKQMISYLNSIAKEVEMLTILDHPNVVKYLGCFTDEPGNTYLVVEFCAGGSLHSMLNRVGSFSIGMVHHYLKDALLGLQYLHANHVVHRDIKPGNLLLTTQGVCKIADFGTARLAPAGWLQDTATGTVCYMCPEAIRGEILPAVDIWAIGVTTCELLSGNRPWSHTNMTNQASLGNYISHFKSDYPIPDWLPTEVKDFITQCLAIDPSNRPTCKDLLLHPFLKSVEFRDSTICGPNTEVLKEKRFGTQSFDL